MGDLRIPIGIFFTLVGLLVGITGLAAGYRAPLESENVNLYCGISILAFGGVMLWLARRSS
jgi:hypothetical protein